MNLLITFALSYIITTGVYYLWYLKRHNLEKREFFKKILFFSLSVSMMITAMYYFVDELEVLLVIFAYLGVLIASDNVLIHTYFPKGSLNLMKIDYFLPGLINTTVIFGLIYLLLF